MRTVRNLLLAAAVWTAADAAAAQADINVGIAGPLSGSALPSGEQVEIGALKAFDHLNEAGGLLGEEIFVTSVDDACEPEQAKAAARQLVKFVLRVRSTMLSAITSVSTERQVLN